METIPLDTEAATWREEETTGKAGGGSEAGRPGRNQGRTVYFPASDKTALEGHLPLPPGGVESLRMTTRASGIFKTLLSGFIILIKAAAFAHLNNEYKMMLL